MMLTKMTKCPNSRSWIFKILLDTDYDEAEHARAEPIYNECDELSSKIRDRADTFIHEKFADFHFQHGQKLKILTQTIKQKLFFYKQDFKNP